MVNKKKNGKDVEVQDGWIGHIIPFSLIQSEKLSNELNDLNNNERRLGEILSLYSETIENLTEDEKEEINSLLKDDNNEFIKTEVTKYVKKLKGKKIELESVDAKMIIIDKAINEEKQLNKMIKQQKSELESVSKKTIENLSDDEILTLLNKKWIYPLVESLNKLPETLLIELSTKIQKLSKKYETTYLDIDKQIQDTELSLANMIDDLDAEKFDKEGLLALQKLLRGEWNGTKITKTWN